MKKINKNTYIRAAARKQLLGKYAACVFAYIISDFILTTASGLFRMQLDVSKLPQLFLYCLIQFIMLLLSGIFLTGQNYLYLNIARGRQYTYRDIWYGFMHLADRVIRIELFITLHMIVRGIPFFIMAVIYLILGGKLLLSLNALLGVQFLINAVVLQITYSQSFFLILDKPDADLRQIMEASILLMNGNKLRYFKLIMSFLGMYILSLLTFGLGFLWVTPYYYSTRANFYLDLLRQRKERLREN